MVCASVGAPSVGVEDSSRYRLPYPTNVKFLDVFHTRRVSGVDFHSPSPIQLNQRERFVGKVSVDSSEFFAVSGVKREGVF